MPRKPKPKPDNPEQFKRFTELAREVGADQPSENFERVLRKVAASQKKKSGKANVPVHQAVRRKSNRDD
jgi:hypothetical protein